MIRLAVSPSVYVGSNSVAMRPRRADSPAAFALLFFGHRLRGTISPAALDSITAAIVQREGSSPGSLADRNNNPGNLVYVGQAGAVRGDGGFAKFQTRADGIQALKNQITLDAVRGSDVTGRPINSISDLISSWAPPSENDTAGYIRFVASTTGYDPDAPLSSLSASNDYAVSLPAETFAAGGSGFDLSQLTSQLETPVDLSSVGGGSVPAYILGVGGLLALAIVSRL